MTEDVFANTVEVYATEEGAAAYVAKESAFETARNVSVYAAFDGMNLQGLRMLDVGCGYGRDVAEFRRRGAEAYGCDVSGPLLAKAQADVGPYFQLHDLRSREPLPFGGPFDIVWCCFVLVHIPRTELAAVLAKMWGALKPGGTLMILTKSGAGEKIVENMGKARIMVYYSAEEIAAELEEKGGCMEVATENYSTTAHGEAVLWVRVRKG